MSAAYYIVLDNEKPGFETFVNGKALAKNMEKVSALCEKLGLRRLDGFVAMSADELADILGEEVETSDEMATKWFAADEGLFVVRGLSAHIKTHLQDMKDSTGVLTDLTEYESILCKAKGIGAILSIVKLKISLLQKME